MMHAVRRACAGVLKGSSKAFSSPLASKSALNSLPSCCVTRKSILFCCLCLVLVYFLLKIHRSTSNRLPLQECNAFIVVCIVNAALSLFSVEISLFLDLMQMHTYELSYVEFCYV